MSPSSSGWQDDTYFWRFRHLYECRKGLSSLDRLIETVDEEIVGPAEAKFKPRLVRRAEPIEDRRV
jgi:hypothetical protein